MTTNCADAIGSGRSSPRAGEPLYSRAFDISDGAPRGATASATPAGFKARPKKLACATTPIVFMIVEDAATREFCGALVRAAGWIPRAFASADEFLAHERVVAPGCLIVEATLPAGGGLELQQRAAAEFAETPIIFVAGVSDAPTIVKAMKAGAVEFLTAPICANAMLSAIDQALDRSRAALVHATEMRALRRRYQTLSPREREVMALVTRGLLNKQAAFRLGVCEITVKAHRGRVMRKMGAASFAELVAMATRLGLAREPQFSNAAPGHFARCA